MSIVGVKLTDKGKVYYFDDNNIKLKKNLTVIVETENGLQFGKVVDYIDDVKLHDKNEYKKVIRISTKKDYLQHLNNLKDAEEAIYKCREFVEKYNLDMRIIDSNYTFDRSQLLFKFVADDRIDFRQLAKDLGSYFKTRIELRQVGIRDKAKEIGGIGPCGRKLCCSTFLTEFDSVSINMAKNQSLALNPTKINGVCGRLLCCLNFENDNYVEYRKNIPEVGDNIKTKKYEGKVISVNLLSQKYKVLTSDNEIIEEAVN